LQQKQKKLLVSTAIRFIKKIRGFEKIVSSWLKQLNITHASNEN